MIVMDMEVSSTCRAADGAGRDAAAILLLLK